MGRKSKFFEEQTVLKKKPHAERLVVVSREEWKARESTEALPAVPVPVRYVVVTWTDTEVCEYPAQCKKTIKQLQDDHMDKQGLPDIRYNFLVGLDKQIYEGRGWDRAGPTYPETIRGADEINGRSIEIAFIDKNMTMPIPDLAETLCRFLAIQLAHDNVAKPIEFKGIQDNKFVRFSRIFRGELAHEMMMDEDDKAEQAERTRQAERLCEEYRPIFAERKALWTKQLEEVVAEQKAIIDSKSPEEIQTEYGFTRYNVDYEKFKALEDKWQAEGQKPAGMPAENT